MASSSSSWLQSFLLNPRKNPLAAMHCKAVSTRLRKFGLRYDDLYDPMEDLDIKEALARLPREIVDARNQRLKRAMDLSMKHEYLSEELQVDALAARLLGLRLEFGVRISVKIGHQHQAKQTPFRYYLQEMLALVKKERAEREALGALPLYQRTIP